MLKVFALSLFFGISLLEASIKQIDAFYDISYGFFGKLGEARATITIQDNKTYQITMKAKATGLARVLSDGLTETYQSTGLLQDSKYLPLTFNKESKNNHKIKNYSYSFNTSNQKITRTYLKEKRIYDEALDINDINKERKSHWQKKTSIKTLQFWANEDILSLFFNVQHYIKKFKKGSIKELRAIGANDKKKGKIDIIVPEGKDYQDLEKILKTNDTIFIVKIYKDIFSSKNGELYISLREDGISNKAVLKDVLFFGDVTAVLKDSK